MYLNSEFGSQPNAVNAYAASSFYAVDRFASFKKFWEKEYKENLAGLWNEINDLKKRGDIWEELKNKGK